MYKKNLKGWFKHIDFVLIDMIMIQLAYVFAFWMRHGVRNPYRISIYAMGGLVLVIAGLINANLAENYKNILHNISYIHFLHKFHNGQLHNGNHLPFYNIHFCIICKYLIRQDL